MAAVELEGIKRTTSSVELGKWQAEIGLPMSALR
jgi:hypothetical protein